jgi:hypothetical protein
MLGYGWLGGSDPDFFLEHVDPQPATLFVATCLVIPVTLLPRSYAQNVWEATLARPRSSGRAGIGGIQPQGARDQPRLHVPLGRDRAVRASP